MNGRHRLEQIQDLLDRLAASLQLEGLKMNSDNAASLVFDERYPVELQVSTDGGLLYLMSALSVAPSSDEDGARICRALLAAPLERPGLGGATFALDRDTAEVVLMRAIATEGLTSRDFEGAVEAFVNTVEHWQRRAQTGVLDPDADSTSGGPTSGGPTDTREGRLVSGLVPFGGSAIRA